MKIEIRPDFIAMNLLAAVALLIGFLFGKIIVNGLEHSKYVTEFDIKCESKGGVMFVPKGVKGWPEPECRDPDFTIDIIIKEAK
jgi:hypothetical protein